MLKRPVPWLVPYHDVRCREYRRGNFGNSFGHESPPFAAITRFPAEQAAQSDHTGSTMACHVLCMIPHACGCLRSNAWCMCELTSHIPHQAGARPALPTLCPLQHHPNHSESSWPQTERIIAQPTPRAPSLTALRRPRRKPQAAYSPRPPWRRCPRAVPLAGSPPSWP